MVSRLQAYAAGVTRAEVRAQLAARRWQALGSQSLITYTGPPTQAAREWAAVFEAGPRAFLDGASSLVAAGLAKFDVKRIRVSVPAWGSGATRTRASTSGRRGGGGPTTWRAAAAYPAAATRSQRCGEHCGRGPTPRPLSC